METFKFYRNLIFLFFFIVTWNYKNLMYPRSFLCEEAKIKQPLRKELCGIDKEAIWESRFTSFFCLKWMYWLFEIHMNFFIFLYVFENTIKKKQLEPWNSSLIITRKIFQCYIKLLLQKHPKFVTLRLFFKITKKKIENVFKKFQIHMRPEKSINSFEIKEG